MLQDGAVTDYRETVAAIGEASRLPMSILLIGVGNGNMDNLETFDGDDKLLPGCGHDIVQFVKIDHRCAHSLEYATRCSTCCMPGIWYLDDGLHVQVPG